METPDEESEGHIPASSSEVSGRSWSISWCLMFSILTQVCNLRCKLESKSKALVILSQDLVQVKRERDEYKLMAEQIRDRYQSLKKRIKNFSPNLNLMNPCDVTHLSLVEQFAANTPLAHVMLELTEQNKYLLFEVEELKTKLADAESDLKLMRQDLKRESHKVCVLITDPIPFNSLPNARNGTSSSRLKHLPKSPDDGRSSGSTRSIP